jgi:hypothetical protein
VAIGLAVLVGGLIGVILLSAVVLVLYFGGVFDQGSEAAPPPSAQAAATSPAPPPAPAPATEEAPPPATAQETRAKTSPPKPKIRASIVTTKANELRKEAEEALTLAEHHQFAAAFQNYDTFDSRLAQLEIQANPADKWAVDKAKKQVALSKTEMQRIVGEWADPMYNDGLATFIQATDGIDDEEGIIRAYVAIAPALQYKKYMPSGVKRDLNNLVWQCQENLDDDEWARAQALARAKQK